MDDDEGADDGEPPKVARDQGAGCRPNAATRLGGERYSPRRYFWISCSGTIWKRREEAGELGVRWRAALSGGCARACGTACDRVCSGEWRAVPVRA